VAKAASSTRTAHMLGCCFAKNKNGQKKRGKLEQAIWPCQIQSQITASNRNYSVDFAASAVGQCGWVVQPGGADTRSHSQP